MTKNTLIPQESIDEVRLAAKRVAGTNEVLSSRLFEQACCPLPLVTQIPGLTATADAYLAGDSGAGRQLAYLLRVPPGRHVEEVNQADAHKRIEEQIAVLQKRNSPPFDHNADPILPHDRWFSVAVAAALLDVTEAKPTNRHFAVLFEQLEKAEEFRLVADAARKALDGGKQEFTEFRSIVDTVGQGCLGSMSNFPAPIVWPPEGPPADPRSEFEAARRECMFEIGRAIASSFSSENTYRIDAVRARSSCAGDVATISGSGFGSQPSVVVFSTLSGSAQAQVRSWTDSAIEVVLPADVTCGDISIHIPMQPIQACGRTIRTNRAGSGNTHFDGGAARIKTFTANRSTAVLTVQDNATVTLLWDVCPPNALTHLTVRDGRAISEHDVAVTGTQQLNVGIFDNREPIKVSLTASNACSSTPSTKSIEIRHATSPSWPLRDGPFQAGQIEVQIPISAAQTAQSIEVNDYAFVRPPSYRAVVYFPAAHEGATVPLAGSFIPLVWGHAKRWPVEVRSVLSICAGSDPSTADIRQDYHRLTNILRHLARWGYVVACADLSWLTAAENDSYTVAMSDVAHWMMDLPQSSPLRSVVDRSRMGILGHSTSGYAVSEFGSTTDLPVKSAVFVAPAAGSGAVGGIAPRPVLVVSGSADMGSYGAGDAPPAVYGNAGAPKFHVDIGGANHFGYYDNICLAEDAINTISASDQQRIAKAYITAFLEYSLRANQEMVAYLTDTHRVEGLETFTLEFEHLP